MADLPEVLQSVILGPEDRLVVMVAPETTPKVGAKLTERLRELLGEGRALVVGGSAITGLAAIRATKAEGSTVGQCGDMAPTLMFGEREIGSYLSCHLAFGHSGMHSDGQATWSNEASVRSQPKPHGYTSHGHPCCGDAVVGERPSVVARCGGAAICRVCAIDAGRIHEWSQS